MWSTSWPLHGLVHNCVTPQEKASFHLTGLIPGHGYIITVTANNVKASLLNHNRFFVFYFWKLFSQDIGGVLAFMKFLIFSPNREFSEVKYLLSPKGVSEPATLHAFTLKETQPEHIVADTSRQADLVVTPVLVILIAILAGLALVAVCIILVMRVKHSKALAASYHSTNIPLQKGLNSNHCLSEKDPDIIPPNKGTDWKYHQKVNRTLKHNGKITKKIQKKNYVCQTVFLV